jgi:F-type H+-transporting ATPase subunit b
MKRVLLLLVLAAGASVAQEPAKVESKGHEESAPVGDPLIAWKWANFAILALGLGYLMSKNLPTFFNTRTASIQKGIAEAQQVKRDAEQRAAATDARVSALGADIEKFRTEASAQMQREGERIQQETERQIAKLKDQAAQEIESAGKVARRELKTYAAQLALELAEQRIRGRLDPTTEAGLIDRFVGDLKRQGSRN